MNRIFSITTLGVLVLSTNLYAQDAEKEDDKTNIVCRQDPDGEVCEEVKAKTKTPSPEKSEKPEKKSAAVVEKSNVAETSMPPEVTTVEKTESKNDIQIEWNRNIKPEDNRGYTWRLGLGGFLRAGYTNVQNDISGNYGQNDGFELDAARLSINGYFKDSAGFRFQIDGAVRQQSASNDPNARLTVQTRDAFVWWAPISYVKLSVGQFKAPFDGEGLDSTLDVPFASRSVMSQGVSGVDGPNVVGLSRDREVGATLSTDGIFFDEAEEGFGIKYAVGATNGSSAERALNDNDSLAFYGRLDFLYGEMVRVGGGATMNDRTIGLAPNQLDESVFGWAADLSLNISIASISGGVIGETVTNATQNEFSRFGFQGSLAVKEPFLGFQPKFRYSMLDDSSTREGDALTYLTFGVNYVPDYPFRLLLDYTIAGEESPTEIDNNKLEILIEASW